MMRLKHILVAYSRANFKVGYVQGMNYIATHMLYHINNGKHSNLRKDSESTFYLFSALLQNY